MDLATVRDLANVATVLEEVIEASLAEAPSSHDPAIGVLPGFGLDADAVQFLEQGTYGADQPCYCGVQLYA